MSFTACLLPMSQLVCGQWSPVRSPFGKRERWSNSLSLPVDSTCGWCGCHSDQSLFSWILWRRRQSILSNLSRFGYFQFEYSQIRQELAQIHHFQWASSCEIGLNVIPRDQETYRLLSLGSYQFCRRGNRVSLCAARNVEWGAFGSSRRIGLRSRN